MIYFVPIFNSVKEERYGIVFIPRNLKGVL